MRTLRFLFSAVSLMAAAWLFELGAIRCRAESAPAPNLSLYLTIQFEESASGVGWMDPVELLDESGLVVASRVAPPNSEARTVHAVIRSIAGGHVYTVVARATGLN